MSFIKKCLKDKKGLSLVELLCAIAILSIVSTMIGSTLVISSRSYASGTTEIEVQQETQFLSNQIADLIIDATSDVNYEDNVLSINQNTTKYNIIYKPEEQNVYYQDSDYGEELHLLANNITNFKADTSEYEDNGIVRLEISVEKNNRNYDSAFTITSRNKNMQPSEIIPCISSIDKIILEPNQVYDFDATITGVDNKTLNWSVELNGSEFTKIDSNGKLTIAKDEDKSMFFVKISSNERNENSDPKAIKHIRVLIRRVNSLDIYGINTSGIEKQANSTYKITTFLSGYNLNRDLSAAYDNDYVDPYMIEWKDFSYSSDLYEIIEKDNEKLIFKLKRAMNPGEQITITAIAKHPNGENKSQQAYANIKDTWSLISRFVYVELVDGGMKRNTNTKQGDFTQDFDNLAINEYRKKYEYRFKPTDSNEWSIWYNNIVGNENDNMEINLRPDVTAAMLYYKDYDVQIRISIVDENGNTIWPTSNISQDDYIIDATMNKATTKIK